MQLEGLIGKKLGMTQVFDEGGNAVPVTVIQVGPCVVVQKKTDVRDGYTSLQLGFVESGRRPPKANKAAAGHFEKSGVPVTRVLREFRFELDGDEDGLSVGDQVLAKDVFAEAELVDVTGKTIGKGFQGVIKRHGFGGGKASHGSMHHRGPGSIGQSAYPSRVIKGMRGPGRMGNQRVKARNLQVVRVDEERNLVLVKGAVPGSKGNYVFVTKGGF